MKSASPLGPSRRWLAIAAVVVFGLGCTSEAPVRAQWRVTLTTDALVPVVGDRVLVEVLTEGGADACGDAAGEGEPMGEGDAAGEGSSLGCRRIVGASAESDWPISFGVAAPESGSGLRIRAVLFRGGYVDPTGMPATPSRLEVTAALPTASGVTNVLLELPMSCFGTPADLEAGTTCTRSSGGALVSEPMLEADPDLTTGLVAGSWGPGQPVPCEGEAPEGMVCIPGGAFLLGDFLGLSEPNGFETTPEIVVQISPFFLDIDEMTAGRASAIAEMLDEAPLPHDTDTTTDHHACNHTTDGSRDALPANCLSRSFARKACAHGGKRLPTEAEWEYAASSIGEERLFAWGSSDTIDDICRRSVVGRGRVDISSTALFEDESCRSQNGEPIPWGPVAGGDEDDVTAQGVRNLSGNVAEYVEGVMTPYQGACWGGPVPLVDPLCKAPEPSTAAGDLARGGAWSDAPYFARVTVRGVASAPAPRLGFRCAQ